MSDHAVELIPHLAERTRVRVLAPPGWDASAPPMFPAGVEVVPAETPVAPDEVALIHLGNNPHHLWLVPRLRQPRTVAVLHDTVLHHLLVESTVATGNPEEYRSRLDRSDPGRGQKLAKARDAGYHGRLDPFLFPARSCFLREVAAVVVHSERARRDLEADGLSVPVIRIGLAVAEPPHVDPPETRRLLGLPSVGVVLMHLGFLTREKGVADILAAVAAARSAGVAAHLAVVGEGGFGARLMSGAHSLGLTEHVTFTGWVDDLTLRMAPSAADLGVVLRAPSAGETSAAVVRFLATGTPVAVTARRQFLEWDERATPRITPGPSTAADLSRLLLEAAATGSSWRGRRHAARLAYEGRHRPESVAAELLGALERVAGRWTG